MNKDGLALSTAWTARMTAASGPGQVDARAAMFDLVDGPGSD